MICGAIHRFRKYFSRGDVRQTKDSVLYDLGYHHLYLVFYWYIYKAKLIVIRCDTIQKY